MKNKKKLIIIIAVVLVIVLLLVLGYIFFIKKGKLLEDYTITEISEVALTETNQQVTVNNKKINVRMFENELYVDDVRNDDLMLEGLLYVTNKYMIVADESDFGYFIEFAVDENGKTINVDNQIKTEAEYPMFNIKNFRVENGIVVTGGGALLSGLKELLKEELNVPITIADSPLTCVAEGTVIMLDNINLLEK